MLCGLGVLLYAVYIFVDLVLILDSGRYGVGTDDYIWAAIVVYMDIIQLFICIMRCLSASRE